MKKKLPKKNMILYNQNQFVSKKEYIFMLIFYSTLFHLINSSILYQNTELESKIQTLTKSLEHEKSTQQITQSNLLVAEEQVLKLTKGIEESRNECYSLRKQITDVYYNLSLSI